MYVRFLSRKSITKLTLDVSLDVYRITYLPSRVVWADHMYSRFDASFMTKKSSATEELASYDESGGVLPTLWRADSVIHKHEVKVLVYLGARFVFAHFSMRIAVRSTLFTCLSILDVVIENYRPGRRNPLSLSSMLWMKT